MTGTPTADLRMPAAGLDPLRVWVGMHDKSLARSPSDPARPSKFRPVLRGPKP